MRWFVILALLVMPGLAWGADIGNCTQAGVTLPPNSGLSCITLCDGKTNTEEGQTCGTTDGTPGTANTTVGIIRLPTPNHSHIVFYATDESNDGTCAYSVAIEQGSAVSETLNNVGNGILASTGPARIELDRAGPIIRVTLTTVEVGDCDALNVVALMWPPAGP